MVGLFSYGFHEQLTQVNQSYNGSTNHLVRLTKILRKYEHLKWTKL